ncbi:MAG TPA: heparinase II/III family protein [Candidatus Methylacidiphilales bacterium]
MKLRLLPLFLLLSLCDAHAASASGEPLPGPTLADDLQGFSVPLLPNYTSSRPRLLFSEGDRAALQTKAKENPKLWEAVRADAAPLLAEPVKVDDAYWKITRVESAALVWFVEGDARYQEAVRLRLLAYCKEPIWGNTGWRPNVDLVASWYLYYLSVCYDILAPQLSAEDRAAIRDGLASHAQAIFASLAPGPQKVAYDQNHTYTPAVALAAAALALTEEVPDAGEWLRRAAAILARSRYVLGEDGYYYESYSYWSYALHWHVRYAELMERATGNNLFALPVLRDDWLYALHLSLPGKPWAFDIGDTGTWSEKEKTPPPPGAPVTYKRPALTSPNASLLWRVAQSTASQESRAAGDFYASRGADATVPATAFLWFSSGVPAADLAQIKPYHLFPDHDVLAWRSGWGPDATCVLFRCGPPMGHSAAAKLARLTDWEMNCGHVHPDIGAFWLYAKGAYLAVGTGYTAKKSTRDHNTLLVDGKGQAFDGVYHHLKGFPYADLDSVRIAQSWLGDDYAYASGDMGGVYSRIAPGLKLRRSLLATERWLLLVDDLHSADGKTHALTWLCHADAPFQADGSAWIARLPEGQGLAVLPLSKETLTPLAEPSVVQGGIGGKLPMPDRGEPAIHGYDLALSQSQGAADSRLVHLLVPLGKDQKPPTAVVTTQKENQISLDLTWPNGKTEKAILDLDWHGSSSDPGPATLTQP